MSLFKDHKDLYKILLEQAHGKERFIALIAKVCGHLEPDQIYELYELSRERLLREESYFDDDMFSSIIYDKSAKEFFFDDDAYIEKDIVSLIGRDLSMNVIEDVIKWYTENYLKKKDDIKNEIFSSMVLNVTKLVINAKLEGYTDVLHKIIDNSDIVEKYILDSKLFPKEKSLRREIAGLKEKQGKYKSKYFDNSSNIEHLEKWYNELLKRRFNPENIGSGYYDINNLEKSIINHYTNELIPSLFHAEITVDDNANGKLAEHHRSEGSIKKAEKMSKIKNNFVRYLEDNANKGNNYGKVIGLINLVGDTLNFQEIQEMNQEIDWGLTEAVLDTVCPTEKGSKPHVFFGDPNVKEYITPSNFGAGSLYIKGFRNNEEIHLMTKYVVKNIRHGKIDLTEDEDIKSIYAILPEDHADYIYKVRNEKNGGEIKKKSRFSWLKRKKNN